jgi:hypothetical protein
LCASVEWFFLKRPVRPFLEGFSTNSKKSGSVSRARIGSRRLFRRAEKKLNELLKDIPDEYLDRALRRLGEQLNATKKIWDLNAKCLIEIPDEKIR